MELRHLKYFVAVAEELHFGRAAERLHIAQPPLSRQIMNLEEELEVRLFDRTKRRIRLTDAGAYFLKEAKQILVHVEQAAGAVGRIFRGEAGRLTVGFVGSVVHTFLPAGLRAFRERFPDVELVLQELTTAEQIQSLHDGRVDVGFLYPTAKDPLLAVQVLSQAPLLAAVPAKHPLAGRKTLHIRDLAKEPFIANTRSSEPVVRDAFISICHSAGFTPRIAQEAGNVHTVLGLVASGLGACLLPDFIRNIKRPGVRYIPLSGSPPAVKLAVAWRSDNPSPLVRSLVDMISASANLR